MAYDPTVYYETWLTDSEPEHYQGLYDEADELDGFQIAESYDGDEEDEEDED